MVIEQVIRDKLLWFQDTECDNQIQEAKFMLLTKLKRCKLPNLSDIHTT